MKKVDIAELEQLNANLLSLKDDKAGLQDLAERVDKALGTDKIKLTENRVKECFCEDEDEEDVYLHAEYIVSETLKLHINQEYEVARYVRYVLPMPLEDDVSDLLRALVGLRYRAVNALNTQIDEYASDCTELAFIFREISKAIDKLIDPTSRALTRRVDRSLKRFYEEVEPSCDLYQLKIFDYVLADLVNDINTFLAQYPQYITHTELLNPHEPIWTDEGELMSFFDYEIEDGYRRWQ